MKKTVRKYLSVFLAVAMLVTTLLPMGHMLLKAWQHILQNQLRELQVIQHLLKN